MRTLGLCQHLGLNHLGTTTEQDDGFYGEIIQTYQLDHYECRQCGKRIRARRAS